MKRYVTLKPLHNAGKLYEPGSVVELSDHDARWCADQGVIELKPLPDGVTPPVPAVPLAQPLAAPATSGRRCAGCGWR